MRSPDNEIALVLPVGMTLGGVTIWALELARYLQAQGQRVCLLEHVPVEWHAPFKFAGIPGGERIRCAGPSTTVAGRRGVKRFARCYADVLPAVFLPNFTDATYAACAVISRDQPERLRVIGVAHGDNEDYYRSLVYYEAIIHAFIAVSPSIGEKLKQKLPHRADDIHIRSCPVDVPELQDRAYAGYSEPLRLTYAGRLTDHEKKVSRLVPLVRELHARQVSFQLRVIGEGGYEGWLANEVSLLPVGMRELISLEGLQSPDQMDAVWRTTDVSILVSDIEGTPLSMLEAMGHSCVPVVPDVGGIAQVVKHNESGLLYSEGDISQMAGQIKSLSDNRGRLIQMGARAHSIVRAEYSYGSYIPWFSELVDRVWAQPDRSWEQRRKLLPDEPFIPRQSAKQRIKCVAVKMLQIARRVKRATRPLFGP